MTRTIFRPLLLAFLGLAPVAGLHAGVEWTLTRTCTFTVTPTLTATPTFSSTVTPTFTRPPRGTTWSPTSTFTLTSTYTATATPGSGSYGYYLQDRHGTGQASAIKLGQASVTGGNILYITYQVQTYFWQEGLLSFYFPPGFDAPTPANFMILPGWNWALWTTPAYGDVYQFAPAPTPVPVAGFASESQGGTVTVQVGQVSPGQVLSFQYGGPTGFSYNGYGVTATVEVWANPAFYPPPGVGPIPTPLPGLWGTGTPPPTPYLGGRVRGPAAMAVASMGPSHTSTQTSTITHTFTATPTITCTPSASPTVTTTPPIAVDHGHFYCYPNPYDIRLRSQLTFRFPAASSASVEIMDLLGRPVAHLPQSDIYPSGFGPPGIPGVGGSAAGGVALWEGQDDYGEVVAGGLYFAVLKSPGGTQVLKFTILH